MNKRQLAENEKPFQNKEICTSFTHRLYCILCKSQNFSIQNVLQVEGVGRALLQTIPPSPPQFLDQLNTDRGLLLFFSEKGSVNPDFGIGNVLAFNFKKYYAWQSWFKLTYLDLSALLALFSVPPRQEFQRCWLLIAVNNSPDRIYMTTGFAWKNKKCCQIIFRWQNARAELISKKGTQLHR